mgnify:CR=1 FL=1
MNELIFIDGNGNKYIIRNRNDITIEYIPIESKLSSSGVYDGGVYKKAQISSSEFQKVRDLLIDALNNEQAHIQNRIKLSGIVILKSSDSISKCILSPQAEILKLIEQTFQNLFC